MTTTTTRLPSNLRPTTCECMHLVRHGHFWSRNKDGSHIIQATVAENPMLCANFIALSSTELELLLIKILLVHCENREFRIFAPVILTITWRSSYTNLTRKTSRCTSWPKTNFLRQGFRKLSYYIQTDRCLRKHHTTLREGGNDNNNNNNS